MATKFDVNVEVYCEELHIRKTGYPKLNKIP